MRPVRIVMAVMAGLLLIFTALGVVLSRKLSQIQREDLDLRAKNEALEKNRNGAISEKPGEADSLHQREHGELLRLRNEVSRLRQDNLDAKVAKVVPDRRDSLAQSSFEEAARFAAALPPGK